MDLCHQGLCALRRRCCSLQPLCSCCILVLLCSSCCCRRCKWLTGCRGSTDSSRSSSRSSSGGRRRGALQFKLKLFEVVPHVAPTELRIDLEQISDRKTFQWLSTNHRWTYVRTTTITTAATTAATAATAATTAATTAAAATPTTTTHSKHHTRAGRFVREETLQGRWHPLSQTPSSYN